MKGGCVNPAFSSQKLSTASVPVRERLPMWREVFGQAMVRLDIEPTKDMPFHPEGPLCALPGAAYASVSASTVRVSRDRKRVVLGKGVYVRVDLGGPRNSKKKT